MKQQIITFTLKARNWRYQQKDAANHEIIGASTEGYRNLADMLENFERATGLKYIFNPLPKQTSISFIVDR